MKANSEEGKLHRLLLIFDLSKGRGLAIISSRRGEVVSRQAHNLKIPRANRGAATLRRALAALRACSGQASGRGEGG